MPSISSSKHGGFLLILFYHLSYQNCECQIVPSSGIYQRVTQDAAVYPGLKQTGLKLVYSEVGNFDDLVDLTRIEGFLKVGLFCVVRGAFILYRKPNFNIDNADDFKVASGENRCFQPTGFESAQPIGPLALPKRDSITFFTSKNFASIAHPTAMSVTRSFFSSVKASIKSLIIIGKMNWTITIAKGDQYCVRPTDYDASEKSPICMLSDLSVTKIKLSGINIVRVSRGCASSINVTIDVNFCSYYGAIPEVNEALANTLVEDDSLAGRGDADACSGGGDQNRLLKDTLKIYKLLLTRTFNKNILLDFNGDTSLKWKLEMMDITWDIAKRATPTSLISPSYMNQIRELFVMELGKAWNRRQEEGNATRNSGGNDEMVVGLLTEYDYRGLLFHTSQCLQRIGNDHAKSNWAAWEAITKPNATDEQVWKGLVRRKDYNIVIEMAWVIFNMVGGLCHKIFEFAHNFWALYIHFVVNMYLKPVADVEWIRPSELGDINIILGGDTVLKYNKLAIFSSLALFSANSLEPFKRPIAVSAASSNETTAEGKR